MIYPWHLYLMATLYVLTGLNHFRSPKLYLRIMPNYLPFPKFLVVGSGLSEIILAVGLCFENTKNASIYGIIVMLLVFLLVHFYMLTSKKAGMNLPKWVLVIRIPLQFILIGWASYYLNY